MELEKLKNNDNIISESKYIIKNPENNKNNWNKVFPKDAVNEAFGDYNPNPIHIEIGMGDDTFIIEMANRNPGINFIGIEKTDNLIARAVLKIPKYEIRRINSYINPSYDESEEYDSNCKDEVCDLFKCDISIQKEVEEELKNLKLIRYDEKDLLNIFGNEEISVIYLNFFDLCTKIKYNKQKLKAGIFLDVYNRILKSEGKIVMKTDCMDLFEYSIEIFSENGYIVRNVSLDLHNTDEFIVSTEYEKLFTMRDKPIYRLEAYKN